MKKCIVLLLAATAFILSSCLGKPDKIVPVTPFHAEKYLGTWYEIARLDFFHEKGMNHVTATYSLRDDGGIKVLNRGYLSAKGAGAKRKEKPIL